MTIEIPDDLAAVLQVQAQAQGLSSVKLAQLIFQRALALDPTSQSPKNKKSAYGILAQYGPGPSEQEIDANRREMFRGFAEDCLPR